MTTFANNLRAAIAAKPGMTQENLAREVDVTLRAVQKWVSGSSEPSGRKLVALALVLDRDPEWFFASPEEVAA